jgi:DNA invertase Pin-like site-specific DNA recombinase
MTTATCRAIGIVRVSQLADRESERIHSPAEQRERVEALCAREGWRLVAVHDELDVSGGATLEQRPGLSQAVTAVLTGSAERIVGAYTDRLWRSTEVRAQVVRLVEAAGGEVWSAEEGRISNRNGADKFSGTVRTAADELYRDQIREKSGDAVRRAVKRGVLPWPNVPPGYKRVEDGPREGCLEPDPKTASIVADAFRMRADGATITEVRAFLAEHRIQRSYHGVGSMLASHVYLGEIHFGKLENLSAHPAIVDADTFRRVKGVRVSRGRRAKSDRLLARLGVLRCGSCGARMVVGTAHYGQYGLYRCPPTGDCKRRVTISADRVEKIVTDRVRAALADVEGRASVEDNAREAEIALDRAQAELDALIELLDPLEPAARRRLDAATAKRDEAQDRVDHLGGSLRPTITINAAEDWDRLSLDARRALIRAVVARVSIAPGRYHRVTVELVGE